VQPFVLNSQDPTQLVFWANGTGPSRPSAFYKFDIPASVTESKHIKKPTKLFESPGDSFFLDFIAGGFTNGTADPKLVIGMDNVNLHVCYFYLREYPSSIIPGSLVLPCLALPCLASPRLASPRLALPRLASPRLALPCPRPS
jgi:hypothetical protein